MTWNGSGTFSRKTTSVSPATGNTTIDSADMNAYTADVTDGINATRAKNGENSPTANLPMGGYKHTGAADGVDDTDYVTMSQLNDFPNGTFSNNANGNPNISDTVLIVTAVMNIQTWESVGPTGSSADNIWTAMDSIPAGVSWIEIKLSYTDSATTTGDNIFGCKAYARETGGAQAVGEDNSIVNTRYNNPAASSSTEYIYYGLNLGIKIPVDSSIRFDIYWNVLTGDPDGEAAFQATLTGYGYN